MCNTCGCTLTEGNKHLEQAQHSIEVLEDLMSENDHQAQHNRQMVSKNSVLLLNVMSSPGSGKTTLLSKTISHLKDKFRIAVIEGDLETENDADRIRALGVEAIQITTGQACHLDAFLIHKALHQLNLSELDIVFIENVGNLVCPASFDLGQDFNVVLLSSTEGSDKPQKYPVMFKASDCTIISKSELLPFFDDFSVEQVNEQMSRLGKSHPCLTLSAKTEDGLDDWLKWLKDKFERKQELLDSQGMNKKHGRVAHDI